MKDIKIIIINQTFLVQEPEKGEPVTPCMDVYKNKIQSDRSLEKLKFIIVVRVDLQNKELSWIHLFTNSLHEYFEILLGRCI